MAAGALPRTPLGELTALTALPQAPNWWGGAGYPLLKNSIPLSALWTSNLGCSGLAPCLPKSVYQIRLFSELNLFQPPPPL